MRTEHIIRLMMIIIRRMIKNTRRMMIIIRWMINLQHHHQLRVSDHE